MNEADQEQVIRRLEQELLDQRHRRLPLMRRDQTLGIAHILKAHGDAYRDFRKMDLSQIGDVGLRTCLHFLNAGTAHAARWVLSDAEDRSVQDSPPWTELDREAADLIKWGGSYAELAQMHVAWSRGIVRAECNQTERLIRFTMRGHIDPTFMVGQIFSDEKWAEYFFATIPEAEIASLFNDWLTNVKVDEAGRHIAPAFIRQHAVFPKLLTWAESIIFKCLPSAEDMGGFRLNDFVRWYAALFGHCRCICLDEERVDDRAGPINPVGSTCLSLPLANFLSWTCEAADISTSAANRIVNTLRLNSKSVHSSLAAQPVVQTRGGTVFLSPRILTQIHPERMLATAMLAGAGRSAYEWFVHRVESAHVSAIAQTLREHGLIPSERPTLKGTANDPDPLTPDLMVRDKFTNQVLVIEYKHCVPPLSTAGVANRLKDSDRWLGQLDSYANRTRALLGIASESHQLGSSRQVLPLLLLGYPLPIPAVPSSGNAMGDWIAIGEFVKQIPVVRARDIWKFSALRPDVSELLSEAKWVDRECEVDGWRYVRPILTFPRGNMPQWRLPADFYDI